MTVCSPFYSNEIAATTTEITEDISPSLIYHIEIIIIPYFAHCSHHGNK